MVIRANLHNRLCTSVKCIGNNPTTNTNDTEEVAVGERIAYWIRTPQVPGSRPGWYGTFY